MACRVVPGVGFVCGPRERARPCSSCGVRTRAGVLCDAPTQGGTCDRFCCVKCAVHVGTDSDLCPAHARAETAPAPGPTPASLTPTTPCSGCGAPIAWRLTVKGKKMPVDPDPVPDGNIVLNRGGLVVVLDRERMAKLEARTDRERWPRFVSHFVTCPHRAAFRKARP